MEIAFYAPMKAPDHPVPSGDRRMARLLMTALRRAGHRVSIASRLRSFDGRGDARHQRRLAARAEGIVRHFVARRRRNPPDLWFTYHCYHKAPDLVGPRIADAFAIPFVIADASVAPKQAAGAWAAGYAASNAAIRRADRLIAFDPRDLPCLRAFRHAPENDGACDIVALPPPIDWRPPTDAGRERARRDLAGEIGLDPDVPWLVTVAMMRPGAKTDSYRVLARALGQLADRSWTLIVAGDGPARPEVESLFTGCRAVHFLGRIAQPGVRKLYVASDIALWPGIDEGCCMALVEAQAAGLPVVAGRQPGIAAAVRPAETGLLTPVGDTAAFAAAVRALLDAPQRRAALAEAARSMRRFDLDAAARALDDILRSVRSEDSGA